MKTPGKAKPESGMTLSVTQPVETRRRFADLVIGGLLLAFVIGGFIL